jgi:hypothetical protein
MMVHVGFAVLLLAVILGFKWLNSAAVIDSVLFIANITYGPLLGLFMFGILTKRKVTDIFIPLICIVVPLFCYWLSMFSKSNPAGYQIGNELLLINGGLTFLGLYLFSKKSVG